jgi:hypothetical protein
MTCVILHFPNVTQDLKDFFLETQESRKVWLNSQKPRIFFLKTLEQENLFLDTPALFGIFLFPCELCICTGRPIFATLQNGLAC